VSSDERTPPFGIYPDRFDDAPSRDGGRRTDVSVNLDAERVQVKVTEYRSQRCEETGLFNDDELLDGTSTPQGCV
jgi:hypothetical protein